MLEDIAIIDLAGPGFLAPGIVADMKTGDFPPGKVDIGNQVAFGDLLMIEVIDDLAAGMIDRPADIIGSEQLSSKTGRGDRAY